MKAAADPERMRKTARKLWEKPGARERQSEFLRTVDRGPLCGIPKHIQSMTEQEREDYRLFRRKGYSKAESLRLLGKGS